jgi:hypothetical protein
VPTYYIDVREVSDVQAGLKFASDTGVPLVVKNSGKIGMNVIASGTTLISSRQATTSKDGLALPMR